ncbi:MAG: diacylglycerol kinase family protein [Anaerolineales bacterium]|nr:diacylglycerol kinase family protein [Anaerolineales bacterium]
MSSQRRADSRLKSFQYAFSGLWYTIRTQRNAWIHALITVAVIVLGLWLKIGRYDWALIALAIGLVWLAELFNTTLESLIDLVSPDFHPLARVAKDVGASAVLLASLTAVVVGLLILLPPLINKIKLIIQ